MVMIIVSCKCIVSAVAFNALPSASVLATIHLSKRSSWPLYSQCIYRVRLGHWRASESFYGNQSHGGNAVILLGAYIYVYRSAVVVSCSQTQTTTGREWFCCSKVLITIHGKMKTNKKVSLIILFRLGRGAAEYLSARWLAGWMQFTLTWPASQTKEDLPSVDTGIDIFRQ